MEGLEDDADGVAAEARQRVLVERAERGAGDDDAAAARPLEPARHHHQGRFAGARGTDQRDALARLDPERDAAQDIDGAGRARQCQMHVLEQDHRIIGAGRGLHDTSYDAETTRRGSSPATDPRAIWRAA